MSDPIRNRELGCTRGGVGQISGSPDRDVCFALVMGDDGESDNSVDGGDLGSNSFGDGGGLHWLLRGRSRPACEDFGSPRASFACFDWPTEFRRLGRNLAADQQRIDARARDHVPRSGARSQKDVEHVLGRKEERALGCGELLGLLQNIQARPGRHGCNLITENVPTDAACAARPTLRVESPRPELRRGGGRAARHQTRRGPSSKRARLDGRIATGIGGRSCTLPRIWAHTTTTKLSQNTRCQRSGGLRARHSLSGPPRNYSDVIYYLLQCRNR